MESVKDLKIEKHHSSGSMGRGSFLFTDDYSVFDWGKMPDQIKNKGASLCLMSAYFFELLAKKGVSTHYTGVSRNGLCTTTDYLVAPTSKMKIHLVRVEKPAVIKKESGEAVYDYTNIANKRGNFVIPLEVIYRNSLPEGSSVFKRLASGNLRLEDLGLAEQPQSGQKLPWPIVECTTKYEAFDRPLSWDEAKRLCGLEDREADEIRATTLEANDTITREMSRAGFDNDDGKLEFGFDPSRRLMVIDTLGTLDECRFTYNGPTKAYRGVQLSKQIPRDWYIYKQPDWKEQIDAAKRRDKLKWRELVDIKPEQMPQALVNVLEALYPSVANSVLGRELFRSIPPLEEILGEYERFRELNMR